MRNFVETGEKKTVPREVLDMSIYTNLIGMGCVAIGLSAYLSVQIANKHISFIIIVLSSIFILIITFLITKRWLDNEHESKLRSQKEKYDSKIKRLKKEYDTTTLEKTIRDGTQTLIKNAVDYFKIENIKNEMGSTAAIQNLQLDKYGQIIELLADFSLILPDYQENQSIVQEEINHQIEIYQIDEKAFAVFLERILDKYQVTVSKKIRERVAQNVIEHKKVCPNCAESVLLKANVCKHCNYEFKKAPPPKKNAPSSLAQEGVERGKKLYKDGNYQGAIDVLTHAIQAKPNYAVAYYNRAIVYKKIGNIKKAEHDLKEASFLGHKKAQDVLESLGGAGVPA